MSHTLPVFLDPHAITASAAEAGLAAAAIAELQTAARRIGADPGLRAALVAAYHAVFETEAQFEAAVADADAALGDDADAAHALMVLDSTRLVRERQGARGVPPSISRAVNERHGAAWLREAEARGRMAIADWLPGWLRLVASGNLYRLGRLEFVPQPFEHPFRAYRNQAGDVVVLAEDGLRFSDQGYLVGTPSWESRLLETEQAVVGNPISPRGHALREKRRLPRAEWRQVLGPGDSVLDMHVPGEGALTLQAIGDALAQAGPFFERFEPGRRFAAFTCDSWLFSPQLEELVGPDSNIVRWQRSGYLLPDEGGTEDFLTSPLGRRRSTWRRPRATRACAGP
jgi:hypothetical protein